MAEEWRAVTGWVRESGQKTYALAAVLGVTQKVIYRVRA